MPRAAMKPVRVSNRSSAASSASPAAAQRPHLGRHAVRVARNGEEAREDIGLFGG
jgi:hypothetical protein